MKTTLSEMIKPLLINKRVKIKPSVEFETVHELEVHTDCLEIEIKESSEVSRYLPLEEEFEIEEGE